MGSVTDANIVATVPCHPAGRLVYINLTWERPPGDPPDPAIPASQILDEAFGPSPGKQITGTILEVWDKSGDDLEVNPGGAYAAPYVNSAVNTVSWRDTATGVGNASIGGQGVFDFTVLMLLEG